MANQHFERIFQFSIIIFVGLAAFFYYVANDDGVFISVVLACLCFFLSVRFQVKERNDQREMDRERELLDEPDHAERFEDPEETEPIGNSFTPSGREDRNQS